MKRIYLSALIISCSFAAIAQTSSVKGLQFFSGTYKELLAEAKKQRKMVFIDVYTDWCAPCKLMERDVFPVNEVADLYNKSFVNYHLNAEKGEGVQLAADFGVKGYPTYLFLDDSGNVLDRSIDYQAVPAFTALGKRALAAKNLAGNLDALQARYDKGDRQPAFLKTYLSKRTSMGLNNAEVLEVYISALPEQLLKDPEELLFLSKNTGRTVSAAVQLLIRNLSKLSLVQQREVSNRLYNNLLYYAFGIAIKEKRLADATVRLTEIETISPYLSRQHQASIDQLKLRYFTDIKDGARLKPLGYELAAKQMSIPADTIAMKDKQLFQEAMEPFLTGTQDSLKIPGFQVEKRLAERQYSQGIASTLYSVSSSFLSVFEAGDKVLHDALVWAEYTYKLAPNENTKALPDKLKAKMAEQVNDNAI